MPKLNAVLMVVLTLAVIAGAGAVVLLKTPAPAVDPAAAGRHLRNLSDLDPDLRREAESALRRMGPQALPPLREAAKSSDRVLADRASRLLREMEVASTPAIAREPEKPAVIEIAARGDVVEFFLESRGGKFRAGDFANLWVQFRNAGGAPMKVGHALVLDHPEVATFEVIDAENHERKVHAQYLHLTPTDASVITTVPPRGSAMLFEGGKALVESVSKPGPYRIRFVYDATEGGAYRRLVMASEEGVLLPPTRLVSNTITVTVVE